MKKKYSQKTQLKLFKENNLDYSDFGQKNLFFENRDIEKFELIFLSKKDNLVNPYIDKYRSFELDYKN